ncbi:MAG: AAA family ATPase [Chloroflexota bacterium]
MKRPFIHPTNPNHTHRLARARPTPHALLLFLLLLLLGHRAAHAQTALQPTASYWQYSASGRLQNVVTADINHDGILEFLMADEDGKVDLISASGIRQWRYLAQDPILNLNTVNLDGESQPEMEVVLAMRNRLVLLTADGVVIRQIRLNESNPASSINDFEATERQDSLNDGEALIPTAVYGYDSDHDGNEEILVVLNTGVLLLYNQIGQQVWHYQDPNSNSNADPHLALADFDQDGELEMMLALFTPRRFGHVVYLDNEDPRWELSVSGRITAVSPLTFDPALPPQLAISTNLGHVYLYNASRERLWLRTLNKPVTAIAPVQLPQGMALAVGTAVGTVTTFDRNGHRFWTQNLDPDATRGILALSGTAVSIPDGRPTLAVTIEPQISSAGSADLILLGNNRETIGRYESIDMRGLTRLIDINRDNNSELLLARFATLELIGISTSTGESASEWNHSLNAAPLSMLVVDLDKDGTEEIIVGTQDGRIHSLNSNGTIRSLNDPGGAITHLAALPSSPTEPPHVVVVRNETNASEALPQRGWLEIRQPNGEKRSETPFDVPITALLVSDFAPNDGPEIIVGTQNGAIHLFSSGGEPLWSHALSNNSIEHLLVLSGSTQHEPEIILTTRHDLLAIRDINGTLVTRRLATYSGTITQVYTMPANGSEELSPRLLVFVDDGYAYGLNWRGILMAQFAWPLALPGSPTLSIPNEQSLTEAFFKNITAFLVATADGHLLRLDIEENRPIISWQLENEGTITSLHWDDRDGDAVPDTVVVGTQRGQVHIYSRAHTREPKLTNEIDLFSGLFALTVLRRDNSQTADLLFITDNGLVQLYRAQENRPPLLTNPGVELAQGQYSINVAVHDVENDLVHVRLEVQDSDTGEWQPLEEKEINSGNESLFWLVPNPPTSAEGVYYRFHYSDGLYEGYVTPPPGPVPLSLSPLATLARYGLVLFAALGLVTFVLFVRQAQSPDARAQRLLRHIQRTPQDTLRLLENRYIYYDGAVDFLLYLANAARQEPNRLVANLADGLFLLNGRFRAGLSIINSTLDDINEHIPPWHDISRWQMIYKTAAELAEAPTITELSLLRPHLVELLTFLEEREQYAPVLDALLPILTNLRDSERVELADDRLVYLNEAAVLLNRLTLQLPEFSPRMERTLVQGISKRWAGLVSSTIEELRGRADLRLTLKTKRLVPNAQTAVVLEIQNIGRATAENVMAILDENPAYNLLNMPPLIPLLPPGRSRQIEFVIAPAATDSFRLALTITYDDRNQHDKTLAFADMVHLLPPAREFRPVANPYMPGTPLRPNSHLFFGREQLFGFIAENAGRRAHRNVLILVGQRRTGKTSALLRLAEHVPAHLLPVYIDCQSLGVVPGMPALLQEFAWLIADALALRDIDVVVPEPGEWQEEPTRQFQRQFLPHVRSLLPAETTLLLVFDEFEAFESLVEDHILPPTFFTYLRHLMQHSEGLNFIFVGTRRLEEMSADYWSVLFNIALYRKIDYLSPDAATRLITEPVQPNLVYDDLALDKILRVTAGHPYFLQLVCYTLVKRANSERTGYITISDVNAALDEMLRLGEVHFAYLWQRSSFVEKGLLTAVSHLMDRDTPIHPEDLVAFLAPYGIYPTPAEVTMALIQLVERDIMQEITDEGQTRYILRIELVGLWVAKNKSLTKLHASRIEEALLAEATL